MKSECSTSFHDVTLLESPLLKDLEAREGSAAFQGSFFRRGLTVRILKFGFSESSGAEDSCLPQLNPFGPCRGFRSSCGLHEAWAFIRMLVPCLDWITSYDVRKNLKGDVVAGLSVGFMIIPQGMAYARVAGLPSIYGLYTGYVPCLIYSIFGSSRQLALGPTSLVSLLVGEAVKQFADPDSQDPAEQQRYLTLCLLLALMLGAIQVFAGIVRLGWVVRFLSHAVVSGFSSGAAIILGLTQMRYFMGFRTRHETIHMIIRDIIENLKSVHYPSLLMGVSSLIFLLIMKHLGKTHKKLRVMRTLGPILAAAIGTAFIFLSQNPWQIRVTGEVPSGLPEPFLEFPWKEWKDLWTPSLVIAGAAYLESIGIAKTLAARNGYSVDANQELIGLGLANVVGAIYQGFPTGGSFSRSAVSDECGAKTSLAGIISVLLVLLTLLFLTPLFQFLPLPVLGAILISSVCGLVDIDEAMFLFRTDLNDFCVWMLAFCGTLFFGIQVGVMVAVVISLGFVINESANAQCEILGRLPGTTVYRSISQYPDAKTSPGIAVIKFHSHLYFANVSNLRDCLRTFEPLEGANAEATPGMEPGQVQYVIVEMTSVHGIDSAACHALADIHHEYLARGIRLALVNPSQSVMRTLEKAKLIDDVGRQWFFVRIYDAVQLCRADMLRRKNAAHTSASTSLAFPPTLVSTGVEQRCRNFREHRQRRHSDKIRISRGASRERRGVGFFQSLDVISPEQRKLVSSVFDAPYVGASPIDSRVSPLQPIEIVVKNDPREAGEDKAWGEGSLEDSSGGLDMVQHSAPEVLQSEHVLTDEESEWIEENDPLASPRCVFCKYCKGIIPGPDGQLPNYESKHVLVEPCSCDSD